MKLAICGSMRHGKSTAAMYIANNTKLQYNKSTSQAALSIIFNELKSKYGYNTETDCWDDKENRRKEWAEIIWNYNKPDGLTLYRDMVQNQDILDGIRKTAELQAVKTAGLVDLTVWINAENRKIIEPESSCQITAADCDVIIDNNTTLEDFYTNLDNFISTHVLAHV